MLVDGGCLFIGIGRLTGFLISARSVLIGGTVILRGRSRLCRGGVLSAAVLGRLGVVGDLAGRVGVGDLPIGGVGDLPIGGVGDRKSTRLNSSHVASSHAALRFHKKTYLASRRLH